MDDAAAREALRTSLDESFFVEAAAGTGKTYEIVRRVVAVIREGWAPIEALALVTFTEKAAGELRLRLRAALDIEREAWAPETAQRRRLEGALGRLEDATIDTVHGFCREILRTRPVAAGVDPDFIVEGDRDGWLARVFEPWFAERVQAPSPSLARYLARGRVRNPDSTPSRQLFEAVGQILERRELSAPWPRPTVDLEALAQAEQQRLASFAKQVTQGEPEDPLLLACAPLLEFVVWQSEGGGSPEETEARLVELGSRLKEVFLKTGVPLGTGPFTETLSRSELRREGQARARSLLEYASQADQDLAAALREDLREVELRYHETLRRAGRLDFHDLLLKTRDLLRVRPEARHALQERFRCIMVDEFQDTDPLQAEIVLLLAADNPEVSDSRQARPVPGKLVLVGDPKQSIYGFRRANLDVYRSIRESLREHGVRVVQLGTSHRAVEPIQNFVNTAFEPLLRSTIGYVPLLGGPAAETKQPSLVALPVRRPLGRYGRVFGRSVDESTPDTVGSFVAWLVRESGWTVRDGDGRRAIRPSDVCILFRRLRSWGQLASAPFEAALEAHGLDTVLVGARALHGRDEIEAVCTVLHALEWPDDELMVYGALRGPFFGFKDETLWSFRSAHGRLHPFRSVADTADAEVRSALELLRSLSHQRNRRPFAETLNALLRGTRAPVVLGLRPGGARVLANVERVLDLARRYESAEGFSFRGFVRRVRAAANETRATEGVISEESAASGVRIMTVHKAKGLEFPIVILADPGSRLDQKVSRAVDPESQWAAIRIGSLVPESVAKSPQGLSEAHQETLRLAYVACTRARDLLVVPTVGAPPGKWGQSAWLEPVLRNLRPSLRAQPDLSDLPAFGPHSIETPPEPPLPTIQPGRHQTPGGEVVWWDPNSLPPRPPPAYGLAHERFLAPAPDDRSVARYEAWRTELELRREEGRFASAPLVDLKTPPSEGLGAFAIAERTLPGAETRPAGPRFGGLVHAVLGDTPLEALSLHAAPLARLHGRRLGATDDEIEAAERIAALLEEDEIMRRARSAKTCYRQYPVTARGHEGLLQLSFDVLFEEATTWIAVDFVTGRGADDELRARMAHGLGALRQAGWTVQGVVLRV